MLSPEHLLSWWNNLSSTRQGLFLLPSLLKNQPYSLTSGCIILYVLSSVFTHWATNQFTCHEETPPLCLWPLRAELGKWNQTEERDCDTLAVTHWCFSETAKWGNERFSLDCREINKTLVCDLNENRVVNPSGCDIICKKPETIPGG